MLSYWCLVFCEVVLKAVPWREKRERIRFLKYVSN